MDARRPVHMSGFAVLANDRFVLKALEQLGGRERVLYRDIQAVMECQVSLKTIQRALERLENGQYIAAHGKGKKGGRRYMVRCER